MHDRLVAAKLLLQLLYLFAIGSTMLTSIRFQRPEFLFRVQQFDLGLCEKGVANVQ